MSLSALSLDGVTFAYASAEGDGPSVLDGASMELPQGSFALLVGGTGSGKSTLLRLVKPELAPAGRLEGGIRVFGRDVREMDARESAETVGYVFQSPDSQIVCDSVWHEMAFGLENLGVEVPEMRRRVAETCSYLGIEPWFRRGTAELSGGQRQVLALAAALVMRPRLLLLDEPTTMLDPIAEQKLLSLIFQANRMLGVTVLVATHEPRPMLPYATHAFKLEGGDLRELDPSTLETPEPLPAVRARRGEGSGERPCVTVADLWQRYDRDADWVLRGLSLELAEGEVRAVIGANGSGKSTVLGVIAGTLRAQRGRVVNRGRESQALLPQNPKALLSCETVTEELMEWARPGGYGERDVEEALGRIGLSGLGRSHPYDLSGGQQQLLALEKLLLVRPSLLLLDEPTKGLDGDARRRLAERLAEAADAGASVLLSSHDLGFISAVADRVTLLFDGQDAVTEDTADFFERSWVYRE